jgi:ArsR family transcriptional regulator
MTSFIYNQYYTTYGCKPMNGDTANDIDRILSVIENPTRRRILQAIVREPHYPLQLSKELGISQQSVVKNLEVMERNGIVVSYRESSNIGPERIFYRPNSEFTIVIDMRNGMFDTRIMESKPNCDAENDEKIENTKEFKETREKISDIDKQLEDIGKLRSELIGERNKLIKDFLKKINDRTIDYEHRNLLYEMLNNPDMDLSSISEEMGVNESFINQMMDDLMHMLEETR